MFVSLNMNAIHAAVVSIFLNWVVLSNDQQYAILNEEE